MQVQSILLALVQFTVYIQLLRQFHRWHLWSEFRWFVALMTWSATAELGCWWVLIRNGNAGLAYQEVYEGGLLACQLLVIVQLGEIYGLVKSRRDASHWIVLLLFAVLMGAYWGTRTGASTLLQRWQLAALQFEVLFALLTVTHVYWNPRLRLGANHWGLLGGLVLRIALDYLLLTSLTLGLVSYAGVKPWIQPLALMPWGIWMLGFQRHSPPSRVAGWDAARLRSNQVDFRKAVRGLLKRS